MKYVMLKVELMDGLTESLPFIFPNNLTHSVVAEAMCKAVQQERGKVPVVISAGYVAPLRAVRTFGDSESLNVKSRPEDAFIVQFHDYSQGLEDVVEDQG